MDKRTVYIKAEQATIVTNRQIYMRDIIKIYGSDKKLVKSLNEKLIITVPSEKKCKYIVSILKIIELLQKEHPNLIIFNEGKQDLVIEYTPPGKKRKVLELAKTAFVCLAIFFGSAFTIMTFNEDVAVESIFNEIYRLVTGHTKAEGGILEICYSAGLPIGIIVFFNHFFRKKIDSDPTPLQVQLRLYEENMNKAIIENASREGKTIDAE